MASLLHLINKVKSAVQFSSKLWSTSNLFSLNKSFNPFVTQQRNVIYFTHSTGKFRSNKAVTRRFYRLNWGAWIRPRAGRRKHLWRKPYYIRWWTKQHVFCSEEQNKVLDQMVSARYKVPNYFVDDPYEPYQKQINLQKYEITTIIVKLKDFLTNSNQEKRAQGMDILSSILKKLNLDICNEEQIKYLAEYFSARIGDKPNVIEKTIPGLGALCHFVNYNFSMASSLFFTIQNELPIQLLHTDSKLMFYQLIQYLFDRFKTDFISLGANFIYGFLRIVDAETSPTCLMIIFEMFREISAYDQFELFQEDIFDSMACYFPIIYSSLKKDKYFDTKIKLNELLNGAMTVTPKYSKFVMQMVLEKLDSESKESKISCYRLLQMALPKYSSQDVNKFLSELWVSIRIDTLKPKIENDELADHALLTLNKLSDVISNDPESLKILLEKIWKDLEISFKSPELQLTISSVKILISFSSNQINIFKYFFERLHPILMNNLVFNNIQNDQSICLESLFKIIEHYRRIGVPLETNEALKQVTLLIQNIEYKSDEIHKLVILVLNEYVQMCSFDKDDILIIIYFTMNCIERSGFNDHLRNAGFLLIENFSKKFPVISDLFFEDLIQKIGTFTMIDENQIIFYQDVLRSLCQEPMISTKIVDFLMIRLMILKNDNVTFYNFSSNIIETFRICLTKFHLDLPFLSHFYKNCILKLLKYFVQIYFIENCCPPNTMIIEQFAQLIHNFLSFVQISNDQNIWKQITDRILVTVKSKDVSNLLENYDSPVLVDGSNIFQIQFIFHLIYSCLKSFEKSLLSEKILLEIFEQINSYEVKIYSEKIIQLFAMTISEIIKKLMASNYNYLDNLLQKHLDQMKCSLNDDKCAPERKTFFINSLIWICKNLFKMQHYYLNVYVEEILHLDCNNLFIRKSISQMADVIYSKDDYWQTFYSDETLIPMNTFSSELNNLVSNKYDETNDDIHLYILLSHLKFIPQNQIKEKHYLSYIIKGLESKEYTGINMLGLTFLENILKTNPNLLEPQIINLFQTVIELAKINRSLHVRKKALNNVTIMIDLYGEKHLLKLRNKFIQSLRPTLADPKRIVRSSAVKAFFKISILGQPGNNR